MTGRSLVNVRRHAVALVAVVATAMATVAWLRARSDLAEAERDRAALCRAVATTLATVGTDLQPGSGWIAEMGEHGWFFAQGRVSAAADGVGFCLSDPDLAVTLQEIRDSIGSHRNDQAAQQLRELAGRVRERSR